MRDIVFDLVVLSGVVQGSDGQPLAGVSLQAGNSAITSGDLSGGSVSGSATTDAAGAYRLLLLPTTIGSLSIVPLPESGFAATALPNIDVTGDTLLEIIVYPLPGVNIPPFALDGSVRAFASIPLAIRLAATDANGDPLSFQVVTPPTNGSLSGTPPDLTYTPAPGFFGADSFTFKACDGRADSNVATVMIEVVGYNFSGFFPPVDNLPIINQAKAGNAIPVKFSLGGYQGMDIFAPGYPASSRIQCDSAAVVDAIEETATAGNSSLNYDAVTGQYIYVWKTDKAWAGTCRQLVIKLIDGTYHRASFRFTK